MTDRSIVRQITLNPGLCAGALSALLIAMTAAGCTSRPDRPTVQATNGGTGNGAGGNGNPTSPMGGNGTSGNGNAGGNGSGADGSGGSGMAGMPVVGVDDATCTTFTPNRTMKLTPEDPIVAQKMSALTQSQMIELMHGGTGTPTWDQSSFTGNGVQAAGIPEFIMRDGPRGVRAIEGEYKATSFAVAEARAASFDLDLEYRVGKVTGIEMKALNLDLMLAPTINVLRHPAWARAQETYGEDPVVLGEMGSAYVLGLQESVPACPKHFAGNNTDENRTTVKVTVDEKTLREVYLRAFQMVVEKADPACIMAAYNGINGEWCTENHHLLTEILKEEWQWKGFVLSDWEATKGQGEVSANAGLDHEQPTNAAFSQLPGTVPPARIQDAARRILNARAKFGQLADGYRKGFGGGLNIAQEQSHKDLARETEEKGAVLLKNDGILPLKDVTSIVVLGPDANKPVADVSMGAHGLGDRGSSNVTPPYAVSIAAGLTTRAQMAGATVTANTGLDASAANGASVVIIPVTMGHEDEGEAFGGGGDRATLSLNGVHPTHWSKKPSAFIKEVAAVNQNVIVLLAVGSAVIVEDWIDNVKGLVQTFYPGQEGGNAIARLLFGDVNFSGKLPFTVATDESQYPAFDNTSTSTTYEYLHGYRRLEAAGQTPRFWFGYGLSYTTYEYSDLKVLCSQGISEAGRLNVEVTVKNSGTVAGEEVVMLFIKPPVAAGITRPPKELKAFTRVALMPGESKQVQLQVAAKDMNYWADTGWAVQKGEHTVMVGPSADNAKLLTAPFTIN